MDDRIFELIDIETIEKLADIVNDKDLGEITVAYNGKTVTVKGKKLQAAGNYAAPAASVAPAAEKSAPQKQIEGNVVKSPIVGTFYAAPDPSKPPYAEVGKRVKKGDVLMIIESMKLMNEVKSEFDGVVKEILVKNGEAVDFDQPIMIIE